MLKTILKNPPLMILLTFMSTIGIGTCSLMLPIATYNGISFIDAIFTATSAICVTGLSVKDTGTFFTPWGQGFILLMIQFGGLGILTVSVFFIGLLSRGRLKFIEKKWVQESLGESSTLNFYLFLKQVFLFVLTIEFIGAIFLFFGFLGEFGWKKSLSLSFFHSVSAFCNAGFSLFSNSLEGFHNHLYLNIVIMLLIILGGLGFVVLIEIQDYFQRKPKFRFSFHSRIVLWTSTILILGSTILFFLLEPQQQDHSSNEHLLHAFFQSVTCRTAGFNTVPMNSLSDSSLFFSMILMFIGGSPGSTAGGIKTTSFILFILLILNRFRGRERPEIFRRTISKKTIEQILILIISGMVLLQLSTFLLLIFEQNSPYLHHQSRPFLAIVFEAVSAFGTVGLSMGLTPYLTFGSKCLIIFLMFIGRLGPLTLILLMMNVEEVLDYEYPEEEIMVG